MQHPFFKESAEEMVERLYKTWLEKNTFPDNLFLASPNFKSSLIKRLKKFDSDVQEELKKSPNGIIEENDPDFSELEKRLYNSSFEEWLENRRKEFIFINFINKMNRHFNNMLEENPPPKPTHQQLRQKQSHLRLVVNG